MDAPLRAMPTAEVLAIRDTRAWHRLGAVTTVTEITGEVYEGDVIAWSDRAVRLMTEAGRVAVINMWIADVAIT